MISGQKFAIRYDQFSRRLLGVLGGGPSFSAVEVRTDVVAVRLGWLFRARLPRSAVESASPKQMRTLSRGAHGWSHRWLVNGSSEGLVEIALQRRVRAWVAGFPISVGVLIVSVEDPDGLVTALMS